jgi:hypothetical protein
MSKEITAAVLLIGDELLSGRTQDTNLKSIADFRAPLGVDVREARVENTYRTWEPWVAAVLTAEGEVAAVAAESPYALVGASSGTLAPRGGASNVCDASKPYSDAAYVRVQCCAPPGAPPAGGWLVVKTEEEQWTFALSREA